MKPDELRCPICGAEATENDKGRLVLEHDRSRHEMAAVSTAPTTPLQRPSRTGAWWDDD